MSVIIFSPFLKFTPPYPTHFNIVHMGKSEWQICLQIAVLYVCILK